jgi:cell division initiation protein
MSLTSDNVRTQEFTRARRGYDESEVDDLLDEVVAALDERDAQIAELRTRISTADQELADARRAEGPAAPTTSAQPGPDAVAGLLALASRTADEHIAAAQEEAQRVVADAEQQRNQILGELQHEQQRIREARTELRATAEEARSHVESYLTGILAKVQEPLLPDPAAQLRALPA